MGKTFQGDRHFRERQRSCDDAGCDGGLLTAAGENAHDRSGVGFALRYPRLGIRLRGGEYMAIDEF
jgi:hypothetical protein